MTLAETGQILVTLRAAREYGLTAHGHASLAADEQSRRELTELLLDAKRRPDRAPYESWRFRRRSAGVEISALISREGRLAIVVSVEVRRRNRGQR